MGGLPGTASGLLRFRLRLTFLHPDSGAQTVANLLRRYWRERSRTWSMTRRAAWHLTARCYWAQKTRRCTCSTRAPGSLSRRWRPSAAGCCRSRPSLVSADHGALSTHSTATCLVSIWLVDERGRAIYLESDGLSIGWRTRLLAVERPMQFSCKGPLACSSGTLALLSVLLEKTSLP